MVCKLCLKNEANQKGSHIFTHALIKSAINQPGKSGRDYEISHKLSSNLDTQRHVGNSVLPENLKDENGREVPVVNSENGNYWVEDYLFCYSCEKRFTIAENYFIENVYAKLKKNKFNLDLDEFGIQIAAFKSLNTSLLRLCIYIQFWRASVSTKEDFKLRENFEETLRQLINKNLLIDPKDTLNECKKNEQELNNFPLIVTFLQTDEVNLTQNMIFAIPKTSEPYFISLGELLFQLYEVGSEVQFEKNSFFGLNDFIKSNKHINVNKEFFKIGILNDEQRIYFRDNSMNHHVTERMEKQKLKVENLFFQAFRKELSDSESNHYCKLIFSDGFDLTTNNFDKAFIKRFVEAVKL